jgi:hypothetical protein
VIASAESDFVAGIRAGLAVAIAALAAVLLAGLRWFPRGAGALLTDAEREAAKLAGADG